MKTRGIRSPPGTQEIRKSARRRLSVLQFSLSSLTLACEEMSRFQDLKDFFERRLLAAVIRDLGERRTVSGYEEELQRQREILDVILIPEIKLHRADDQLLMVKKEELPPEQQERSPYPDQEENESPLIKEEQEEVWIGQRREQLQGLEEADTKVLFPSVHMKSENDEEEPESSLLHHRLTDHMETAAGREDCGRPEPARSSDPERNLQAEIEVQTDTSSDTGSWTEDEEDDWKKTRDYVRRFNSAKTNRRKTVGQEPRGTNHVVSLKEKRPFSCSECGKSFTYRGSFSKHMLVHTTENPFKCCECGKEFSHKRHLTSHMLVHTKEKPFECSECGKGFSCKQHLTSHMLVHTKEKPFSCSECGKRFNHKASLNIHLFVHSKEKPFSCSECGKGFSCKQHLTSHMLVHTKEKPFKCSECGKRFNHKASLNIHLYVHSKEKPFSCSECGKGFITKHSLTKHMVNHSTLAALNVGM
ncbi:uncharacterized protein LOC141787458 [Halichoeres trimaculatus]|uniref:uncharacterized protein LOC141787458 n=1 Tax=Halichoeres trimaculatus TaxID=147232 RepID=UPI003D9E7055